MKQELCAVKDKSQEYSPVVVSYLKDNWKNIAIYAIKNSRILLKTGGDDGLSPGEQVMKKLIENLTYSAIFTDLTNIGVSHSLVTTYAPIVIPTVVIAYTGYRVYLNVLEQNKLKTEKRERFEKFENVYGSNNI